MENPPPYNPVPQGQGYLPQVNPGYLSQQDQPGDPQASAPPPSYLQPTPGYPSEIHTGYQSTTGYPTQCTGYPRDPTKGCAHPIAGSPPLHGYVQQPGQSQISGYNATVVITQPSVVTTAVMPPLQDHMALSIFACLCFCWFIGIFAIIKSSEARNRYRTGDYTGALSSAQSARNLSIASIACGVSIACSIFIIQMVAIANYN